MSQLIYGSVKFSSFFKKGRATEIEKNTLTQVTDSFNHLDVHIRSLKKYI